MAAEDDNGAKQDGDRKGWEGMAKLWGKHDQLLWLPRGSQRVASHRGSAHYHRGNGCRAPLYFQFPFLLLVRLGRAVEK
jgi:hypothetical protein